MHAQTLAVATAMLLSSSACTLILDFEDEEAECWCGEEWKVQISGATATSVFDVSWPIPTTSTTHVTCVSQLEHLALDAADPEDPLHVAIRSSLENAAIAKCEAAGAEHWGVLFANTNCASTGVEPVSANTVHLGACWKKEDWDNDEWCPLFPECRPYYDCSNVPIWDGGDGDDEAGNAVEWECDEDS